MRINTADGAIQVNKTSNGVSFSTYGKDDAVQHMVFLSDNDARAAYALLGRALLEPDTEADNRPLITHLTAAGHAEYLRTGKIPTHGIVAEEPSSADPKETP